MITKKHTKSKHTKSKHTKSKHTKSKYTKNTKHNDYLSLNKIKTKNLENILYLNLTKNQIEFILMYSTIINHLLLLIKNNIPKSKIKETIINLFKDLRKHNYYINKNISDVQLNILFKKLYNQTLKIQNHVKTKEYITNTDTNKNQSGGFYFKSLEEKGDQPLTGTDLAKLLDEMQAFFYNAQYVDEGKFLQDTNTLISMLRGDLGQFKGMVQYRILPQYYQVTPPFIKWGNIKKAFEEKKYEDIPDYLLAYQTYLRSRDEYLVDKGLKSPNVLNKDRYKGFYNNLANSLDKNITMFQQYRNKMTGKISPIALPT